MAALLLRRDDTVVVVCALAYSVHNPGEEPFDFQALQVSDATCCVHDGRHVDLAHVVWVQSAHLPEDGRCAQSRHFWYMSRSAHRLVESYNTNPLMLVSPFMQACLAAPMWTSSRMLLSSKVLATVLVVVYA